MRNHAIVSLLLTATIAAQVESPVAAAEADLLPDVVTKLTSELARDVAWGGYMAQHFRLQAAAPELRQSLRAWHGHSGDRARIVRLLLVDALWSLGAEVASEDIEPLLDDPLTRVPAFVLLARDVRKHTAALGRIAMGNADGHDLTRLCAGAVLLDKGIKVPGLAAFLLSHADYQLRLYVRDDSDDPSGSAIGLGAVPLLLRAPRGFPPLVQHRLIADEWASRPDGDLRLVHHGGGADATIWHQRTEAAAVDLRPEFQTGPSAAPATDDVANWIERMADLRLEPHARVALRWRDRAAMRRDVLQAQARMRGVLEQIVARLRREGWLAADELPGFHLEFGTELVDQRTDRHEPLPSLQELTAQQQFVFFGADRERIHDAAFLACTAIAGAQLRFTWRQLEPERDRYALQPLLDDCAFLQAHGKKLWLQLQDVSFGDRLPVPDYLCQDPAYGGGAARKFESRDDAAEERADGWVARRWDPAVQQRFARLLAAIADELDGRLEGVNLAETAIDFGRLQEHQPAGFSPAAYAKAVCDGMDAARAAFEHSQVLIYANFMPGEWLPEDDQGYLRSVYEHAAKIGVGVGGPDLLPFRKGQQHHCLKLLAARPSGVLGALAVQDGNLAAIDPNTQQCVTAAELLRIAREQLRLDYVFWGTEEPYWSQQVLPLLQAMQAGAANGR